MKTNKRIDILSLINLISLFFESHLDFLAKLLEISLNNLYIVYKSATIISISLNAIYAIFSVFDE